MGGVIDLVDDVFGTDLSGDEAAAQQQQAAANQAAAMADMQAQTTQALQDQQAQGITDSRARRKQQITASRKSAAAKRSSLQRGEQAANISNIASQQGEGMSAGSSSSLRQKATKPGYGKYKQPGGLTLRLRGSSGGGGVRPT